MKYTILLLFIPNLIFGQFEKSFTNVEEYQLSNKIQNALASESYSYCTTLTDKLIAITNEPDKIVMQDCIECSLKANNQTQTATLLKIASNQTYKLPKSFESDILECCPNLHEEYSALFKEVRIKASNFELANELAQMFVDDQVCRSMMFQPLVDFAKELGYEVTINHERTCVEADSINVIKLEKILNKYPNIGINDVGSFGMSAMTATIQHSGNNKKYKKQMDKWLEKGDILGRTYGTYIDRLNVQIGQPQIYGTQFSCESYLEIDDLDKINERRMKLGMISIERYVKYFGKIWKSYLMDCE